MGAGRRDVRIAVLAAAALLAACAGGGSTPDGTGDAARDDGTDGETATEGGDGGDAGDACVLVCGTACCARGERCFRDRCIEDVGTCVAPDGPCQNDALCVDGVCVRYGVDPVGETDPSCRREPTPLTSFEPERQCAWPGTFAVDAPESTDVRVPPLVGDLDLDGLPEIVFSTWNSTGGPYMPRIRAIHGDDCSPVWTTDWDADLNGQLALGDLTGDGRPEICGRGSNYTANTVAFCLGPDGALLWEGHDGSGARVYAAAGYHDVGINIANVDGAGSPEVIVGLDVFDGPTGLLRRSGGAPTRGLAGWPAAMPAVADVDADGRLEALTGGRIYDLATGETTDWGTDEGFVAVAELSAAHAGPEVVVVTPDASRIRVHALDGTIVFEHAVPGGSGGAPTVADLDGDGQAEFSAAGNQYLTAFDLDCVGPAPDPARCVAAGATDGVMWSVGTHELSSGFTGSSVFDFEGDGPVEVVYGDECFTRVFDGRTGAVKFSTAHESMTGIEYPVVADVDGDFYTEIVAPHERYPSLTCPAEDPLAPGVFRDSTHAYTGLEVLRDRTDRWAPSRPLWSQHAEHFDQRNDDGTVPLIETPSWTTHNSYRRALPRTGGTAIDTPNLTVGDLEAPPCDETAHEQRLSARVCNRGTLPVGAGAVVAFRLDAPDGLELCRAVTAAALAPGACERVECLWEFTPIGEPHDVYAVVDPADVAAVAECREDDNTAIRRVQCPPAPI